MGESLFFNHTESVREFLIEAQWNASVKRVGGTNKLDDQLTTEWFNAWISCSFFSMWKGGKEGDQGGDEEDGEEGEAKEKKKITRGKCGETSGGELS